MAYFNHAFKKSFLATGGTQNSTVITLPDGSTTTASTSDGYLITRGLPTYTLNQLSENAVSATTSQYVYISAYQYIGRTLASNDTLGYSGSFSGSFFGNGAGVTNISASSIVGLSLFSIGTGSITASVDVNPNNLFLIKSGSTQYLNISSSSNTTLSSNLFIVKNFTTQQPLLTVSQSIVQIATQSFNPSGTTDAGSIWFTSSSMYIGLEN